MAESLDWESVELRQKVVLCAALFEARGGWMIDLGGDEASAFRELKASLALQGIYRSRTMSFLRDPDPSTDRRRSPVIREPLPITPFNLERAVSDARDRLKLFFLATGAVRELPPVCEADLTCKSCWKTLEAMQDQK